MRSDHGLLRAFAAPATVTAPGQVFFPMHGNDRFARPCRVGALLDRAAAVSAGARTTEALGRELRCGTNCGSCVPELAQTIRTLERTEYLQSTPST